MPSELLQQLRDLDRLPTIPGVAIEIINLLQQDEVPIDRLVQVLGRDPALVTKVLRTANSSMFGARREIANVKQAITLLGLRTVNLLALSFSLVATRGPRSGPFDHRRYWRQSAVMTTAARYLAGRVAPTLRDEAFLAGLLCKLGLLVLSDGLAERYGPLLEEAAKGERDLHDLEREALGTTHAELAGDLLDEWGLPPTVCRSVAAQFDPESLEPGSRERTLAQILRVAVTCGELCFGRNLEEAAIAIKQLAASYFNLDSEGCGELIAHIERELPQAARLLEAELDDPRALSEVFMRAGQLMVKETLALNQQVKQATATAERLQKRATTDPLTGLGNRGFFDETLEAALAEARRAGAPLGLLVLDLDHFKSVNDGYGHRVGDEMLRRTGAAVNAWAAVDELAFRYGGEEIAVILPGVGAARLRERAEALRAAIAEIEIATPKGPLRRTASIGGAWTAHASEATTGGDLVEAADRQLYAAKAAGRNQVKITA
jgi:diguanylate cyclase (GGDEF)-like protein